jgi:hypothetical protein
MPSGSNDLRVRHKGRIATAHARMIRQAVSKQPLLENKSMNNINAGISGLSLALVAASMASISAPAHAGSEAAAKAEVGHCMGVNSCKGHNGCKTAANACKGQGGCKGQGFVATTADACTAMGGKMDSGAGMAMAEQADTVKCYGANACKGHNDCKTASNACKGQGGCKGQGFVAIPASTCADVGGTTKS